MCGAFGAWRETAAERREASDSQWLAGNRTPDEPCGLSIETQIQIHLLWNVAQKLCEFLLVDRFSASRINSARGYSSVKVSFTVGAQIAGYRYAYVVAFGIVTFHRVTGRSHDSATSARRNYGAVVSIGDFRLYRHRFQEFYRFIELVREGLE